MPKRKLGRKEQVRFLRTFTNQYGDKCVSVYRIADNEYLGQIVRDHSWSAWALDERLCMYLQDPKHGAIRQRDMSFRRLREAKAHVRKENGYPPDDKKGKPCPST